MSKNIIRLVLVSRKVRVWANLLLSDACHLTPLYPQPVQSDRMVDKRRRNAGHCMTDVTRMHVKLRDCSEYCMCTFHTQFFHR